MSKIYDYFEFLSFAEMRLQGNPDVKKVKVHYEPSNAALVANSNLTGFLLDLYKLQDGFLLEWEKDRNEDLLGQIKIIKLEHFLNGLKAIDSNIQAGDELYEFHQLDLISDEAHCGLFIKDGEVQDRMYYNYWGEEEAKDLKISVEGYLNLAQKVAGFRYWPLYLLEYFGGGETAESKRFKDHMPTIMTEFPGCSLEEFNGFIEEYRLDK